MTQKKESLDRSTEPRTIPIAATFTGMPGSLSVAVTKVGPSQGGPPKGGGFTKMMARVRDLNGVISLGQRVWELVQHLSVRTQPARG